MKTYGRVKVWLHALLTSALDGGEWSAHPPAALPPGKIPQHPMARRQGGPESRSGRDGEEKKSLPYQESNPGGMKMSTLVLQPGNRPTVPATDVTIIDAYGA